MKTYSRHINYEGHSNKRIQEIEEEIQHLEGAVNALQAEKEHIRDMCDHDFLFVSSGPYEDVYQCSKCGAVELK